MGMGALLRPADRPAQAHCLHPAAHTLDALHRTRQYWSAPIIATNGLDLTRAPALPEQGVEIVLLTHPFIANSESVEQLGAGTDLAEPDGPTVSSGTKRSYIDDPAIGTLRAERFDVS